MNFEKAYTQFILPLYSTNYYEHDYDIHGKTINPFRIEKRLDLTHLNCYTIDPTIDCFDPDDAFSFYNGKLYIHIADPTHYFTPESKCFNAIYKNGLTHYPSKGMVRHMMPDAIIRHAALSNGIKNAITVSVNICPVTFLPKGNVDINFTIVKCSESTKFTYETARNGIQNIDLYLTIANCMRGLRNGVGDKLAELSGDDPEILEIKQMIAEFAIFSNSAVAQYLKIKLGTGIFRLFNKEINQNWNNLHSSELMQMIIQNGMSAEYLTTSGAHELLNIPEYCHFTSPLRRVSDCICHYLLKTAYFNYESPFLYTDLIKIVEHIDYITKKEKKIQYADKKFCFFQNVYNKTPFLLQFRILGYTGLFLNIMLEWIYPNPISISYTLRVGPDYKKWDFFQNVPVHTIIITIVNVPGRYDKGTLPELDEYLL